MADRYYTRFAPTHQVDMPPDSEGDPVLNQRRLTAAVAALLPSNGAPGHPL